MIIIVVISVCFCFSQWLNAIKIYIILPKAQPLLDNRARNSSNLYEKWLEYNVKVEINT